VRVSFHIEQSRLWLRRIEGMLIAYRNGHHMAFGNRLLFQVSAYVLVENSVDIFYLKVKPYEKLTAPPVTHIILKKN
jgi:hypothetical protein